MDIWLQEKNNRKLGYRQESLADKSSVFLGKTDPLRWLNTDQIQPHVEK